MSHDPWPLSAGYFRSARRRQWRWRVPAATLPVLLILLLLAVAFAPQWFTSMTPDELDMDAVLQAPGWRHPFGTDALGRDVYTRVVYGTALSFSIGVGATLIACIGGVVLALLASLPPQAIRQPVVRLLDILLAFPEMLLALLVIAVLGRGAFNTLLAVGLSGIAAYARLLRAQILQVRQSGYVQQAIVMGEAPLTIIARHILPNALRPLLIVATLGIGQSVLSASSLSFLGLGVVPPTAEWGALLAEGRDFLDIAPWISLLPATVVAATVITLTLSARRLQSYLARGV